MFTYTLLNFIFERKFLYFKLHLNLKLKLQKLIRKKYTENIVLIAKYLMNSIRRSFLGSAFRLAD